MGTGRRRQEKREKEENDEKEVQEEKRKVTWAVSFSVFSRLVEFPDNVLMVVEECIGD